MFPTIRSFILTVRLDTFAKEYLDKIEQVSEITLVNFAIFTIPRTPIKAMMISSKEKKIRARKKAQKKWGTITCTLRLPAPICLNF